MILVTHMAGLAKPNKIITSIGSFRAVEKPKWFDVVNGQALSYVFPAIIAIPALIQHDSRAQNIKLLRLQREAKARADA